MPSDKPQINLYITPEQKAAVEAALAVTGDGLSKAARQGLRLYCEQHNIQWPDDMPQRGKYERE